MRQASLSQEASASHAMAALPPTDRSLSSLQQLPMTEPEIVQQAFSWPDSWYEPSFVERALRWQGDEEGKMTVQNGIYCLSPSFCYYETKPVGPAKHGDLAL